MLNFIKGDPELLEGRAIIYLRNTSGTNGNMENPESPAHFVASTPEDMVRVAKHYRGGVSPGYKEFIESMYPVKEGERCMYSLVAPIFCIDDLDIPNTEADIIRLPDIPTAKFANQMLNSASELYMSLHRSRAEEIRQSGLKRYGETDNKTFMSQAIDLTQRVFRSMEDRAPYRRYERALRYIVQGTVLSGDVDRFFEAAKTSNPVLMTLLMEKIFAVASEDYIKAAELRDKIVGKTAEKAKT